MLKTLGCLALAGRQHVRDLWRQKDLADAKGTLQATVPAHGVMLYKLTSVK